MNSTLIKPILLRRDISRLKKLPPTSIKREEIITKLIKASEECLILISTPDVQELLLRRYVCPFQLLPHEDRNFKKIADIIVRAITDPGFVKELCFVSSIEETVKLSLVEKMTISFSPYVTTDFRFFKGRDILQ